MKDIFIDEYPKAEIFYRKNKKLMLKIRKLEAKKKIIIPREITLDEFNDCLKNWKREEIIV